MKQKPLVLVYNIFQVPVWLVFPLIQFRMGLSHVSSWKEMKGIYLSKLFKRNLNFISMMHLNLNVLNKGEQIDFLMIERTEQLLSLIDSGGGKIVEKEPCIKSWISVDWKDNKVLCINQSSMKMPFKRFFLTVPKKGFFLLKSSNCLILNRVLKCGLSISPFSSLEEAVSCWSTSLCRMINVFVQNSGHRDSSPLTSKWQIGFSPQ